MKRKILFLTVAFLLILALPALANPFSDLAADHWAYDAVTQLVEEGVVIGYPAGAFQGNNTMSRYEMATIVARAMAAGESNQVKISAENKAYINQLAAEFAQELQSLGVRIAILEEKVGSVKFNGDARIRYQHYVNDGVKPDKDRYQIRVRLRATAAVNDRIKVIGRFTTGNRNLDDKSGGGADATFDHYFVSYNDQKFGAQVGSFWLGLGDIIGIGYPTLADCEVLGTKATVALGNQAELTLVGGRVNKDYLSSGYYNHTSFDDLNLYGAELNGRFNRVTLMADYLQHTAKSNENLFGVKEDTMSIWSIGGNYKFSDNMLGFAQYWQSDWDVTKQTTGKKVDDAGFLVGVQAKLHPRMNLQALYGKIGGASLIAGMSTHSFGLEAPVFLQIDESADVWKVGLYYQLLKGVVWDAEYFQVQGKVDERGKTGDYVQTRLNFKF